jgi:hypothetical protein
MNNRKFELQAMGRGLFVSAHKLSPLEVGLVKEYCMENEEDTQYISTLLDGVLEDYDPFETSEWQTGVLALVDNVSLDICDSEGNKVFSLTDILNSGAEVIDDYDLQYEVEPKDGDLLLFCEDYKGNVASWVFPESTDLKAPLLAKDFSIKIGRIDINEDQTEYIEKVFYKGVELEQSYDNISMEGKGAYSALF